MQFKELSTRVIAPTVAAVTLAAGIAACGGSGIEESSSSGDAQTVPSGAAGTHLTISQWPLYVDPGKNGTVNQFSDETGIDMKWIEDINDNAEFFAKIQPLLAHGQTGGRDIITVSDWLAKRMYDLGYLYRFDKSQVPNFEKNLIPQLRHPPADPNRDFTAPWQAGMTGLIVNTDLAPEAHSICDLFNPQYKGQVTMLTELRDSVPMTLKCMGIDPEKATEDQWMAAVDKIREAKDAGQFRAFTGNDYIRGLSNGDIAIALGWSGDAIQLQADNPNIQFVMPTEGCMFWSTSMEIPVGAPDPQAAQKFINYVYDPKNQAQIAAWVNYVTPVAGVKQIFEKTDPELASNQLIFPTQQYTRNCTYEPVLAGPMGDRITKAFESVITG
ncbi:MAG TPA: spermidine/putrescine ABC transporter substrate-binding protein [Solirubrobacterales bacterium]